MKFKLITNDNKTQFEKKLNDLGEIFNIKDIKYTTNFAVTSDKLIYSALIIYTEKEQNLPRI